MQTTALPKYISGRIFDQSFLFFSGKAGGWHEYFDEEMTLQADRWIEDNLKDTDLRFPHIKY